MLQEIFSARSAANAADPTLYILYIKSERDQQRHYLLCGQYPAVIKFSFSAPVDHGSVSSGFSFKDNAGLAIPYTPSFENSDSTLVIQPASALKNITKYLLAISFGLQSQGKTALQSGTNVVLITAIDSSDKFPRITDSAC